jgi:hypothetical protein
VAMIVHEEAAAAAAADAEGGVEGGKP